MADDVQQALQDIRRRGDKLLDGFEDLLLNDQERAAVTEALRDFKDRQDDLAAILESIKKTPSP